MLKTVILDCDGVMFDSKNANRHYYNYLLENFGYPAMDDDELDYVHIHSVKDSVQYIFRKYPKQNLEEIHSFRLQSDYKPFLRYMEMEPDLLPFLKKTCKRYNLAIATNRTNTMASLLEEFNLQGYFGKVMTAENSRRPKPAADPLLEIIDHFNCSVQEAIYVGDSIIDEQTAKNCDMMLVAFRNRQLQAEFHVECFQEILQLPPFLEIIA